MRRSTSLIVMSNLAGATVALVILVDLVTGDGPPILNAYRAQMVGPGAGYLAPPPPPGVPLQPLGYLPRGEYDPAKAERDYANTREEYEKSASGYAIPKEHEKHLKKELELLKQHEDKLADKGLGYEKNPYLLASSTPAPGMLSSLSHSVSGAWGSLTGLGRKVRSADEAEKDKGEAKKESSSSEPIVAKEPKEKKPSSEKKQASRSFENYESIQNLNQGYIYFKVPRSIVCGQSY